MASHIIQQYLASPPYLGRSVFADRTYVRQTCGATCCFDEQKKMWGTRQIDCLVQLVRSRKFQPFGIEPGWNHELVDAAQAYAAEAEAAWIAQNAALKPAKEAPHPLLKKPKGAPPEKKPKKLVAKVISKPVPRNQGRLTFKPAAKEQGQNGQSWELTGVFT